MGSVYASPPNSAMTSEVAMSQLVILGLSLAAVLVGAFALLAYRFWKRTMLLAQTIDRIAPVLLEPDAFFELMEISQRRSHFLERHGPMLKLVEIRERAQTGSLPASGLTGKPVSSGRWFRHDDLLRAVNSAREHWLNGAKPKDGVFRFRFERMIGEGYVRGSQTPVATDCAIVVIKGDTVVTAYPAIDGAITSAWRDVEISGIVAK